MKILFVLEHYHPYIGGAEKLFRQLAESLAAESNEICVITTQFDHNLKQEEILNQVEIKRIDCKNRFQFTYKVLPSLLKESKKFDFIHTTTYTAALPAWIAAKINRKKIFLTFHEHWNQLWFELPFLNFLERTSFFLFEKIIFSLPFDKIIAVSDFTKNELIQQGKKEKNVIRIYNGIEKKEIFLKRNIPKNFTCTYFGRLGVSKGLDILIPSIREHLKKHPNSIFNIVIPTRPKKMYNKIFSLINKHGLTSKINIFSELEQNELEQLILNSSCIAIPSYSEGFCFTAVEAIDLGIPIISSGKGALQETVSGKYLIMEKMDVPSFIDVLEKAKNEQWEISPQKNFPLHNAIQQYKELIYHQ